MTTETALHIPVMLTEVLDGLQVHRGGTYVDGTFGAGGYSRAILEASSDTCVVAIDRDPEAAPRAEDLASRYPGRFLFLPGRFGDMAALLQQAGVGLVDGITLDVGVSSMQIDTPGRGFSFMREGPLDMRMEKAGLSAADVVNTFEEEDIASILYRLGEERQSRRIARAIVRERHNGPLQTTRQLAEIVRSVVHKGKDTIDPATRTFQGLRIFVNDEIGELRRGLEGAQSILAPGGRLAVVSFHSLEDREVKAFLSERSAKSASRLLPGEIPPPPATFVGSGRKAVQCSAAEAQRNPRARSAKLRVDTRTDSPAQDGAA
ncbi:MULTISPECIES: 16S rRNA (cytosine(1402)-N(4))-methyltransferase RsmH [unclassified Haematospirillum]|uniref:16S rRNA (cytosine(1402)-N(4))-methyltransferase RsmH n=1 Tax=unclassified Haematospirillum TaxID=2622088 RepID=UPI00143B294F|nr:MULTISPECIES: 16S rRNA (cytosine(1402)-N(4))-methyltransferase RsmH [unclassified Haematospirillum]NKD54795.1 16S rRNA (cytosine(1402)-N(4))-methyltransferase RsmH [Haematospirillum sp. H4890]NKD74633.1 16S rRNA (cytosine(1402)-N(4))-methyltransferase RsmH [Haematospirillum sp. H4485]